MSRDSEESNEQTVGGEKSRGGHASDPSSSYEAGGKLTDRLKTSPDDQGDTPAQHGDPDVRAGRTRSGRSQSSETSSEATRREEAAGHGSGGYGGSGSAPRQQVDVAQPRAEDLDRAAERKAERTVALCFLLVPVCAVAFTVAYFLLETDDTVTFAGTSYALQTPLLGFFLGVALTAMGVGAVIWAKKLMTDTEAVQEREEFSSTPESRAAVTETWNEGVENSGIARRALVRNSVLLGSTFIVLPLTLPLLSLGRWKFKEEALYTTNWATGLRMVREDGSPVLAAAVPFGGLITVYPEGHTTLEDKADAATLLIRLRPGQDNPLPGREDWNVDGIVAYSKICTHAGCPVGLYEQTTHHLLCPCHQSTFLVTEHARPIFGPAARPLPQLRIAVDEEGFLVAEGDYDEPTGPSFWERAS